MKAVRMLMKVNNRSRSSRKRKSKMISRLKKETSRKKNNKLEC